ncbi:succinate dehydrogenase and fumarate reductase iron-sulfur protein [Candidatus Methanoperedens nitroreducens]|uniref:succinate dehydrogenase n=1 Tax=Candidatus Methanoperedens nitratireducens TaxID=1392998 RepID=A0A062V554_9EURY|nr:succinate dehydrogenase iron-sulfur subunit [Candidatus Methanoperedens nitroreducens]KCZ72422.1 succinate dehydrogenase and fumarate reductase iron-sulfur protein [Candidatus Methanoperedens nitroreducens]MDJ1423643.1 succinate dehydrogenase iron-sulfur subunit [Candidatus Methanoperedens sp.]
MGNTINLKIFRLDPENARHEPYYQTYTVKTKPGMTVLEALFNVLDEQDGTLSFRYSCRWAICGSCAMTLNGKCRLACKTQISEYRGTLTIEPLPGLDIIKDLVVDLEPFFNNYRKIKPYLVPEGMPDKENIQMQEDVDLIEPHIKCILCAVCETSCPISWTSREKYIGPMALTKVYRFNRDTRDAGGKERLEVVRGEDGVWRCRTIFRCTEYCPKNIPITEAIQFLKRKSVFK